MFIGDKSVIGEDTGICGHNYEHAGLKFAPTVVSASTNDHWLAAGIIPPGIIPPGIIPPGIIPPGLPLELLASFSFLVAASAFAGSAPILHADVAWCGMINTMQHSVA